MSKELRNPEQIIESLAALRDEFSSRAFGTFNQVIDATYAEAVWKINSCLYSGYPVKEKQNGR